VVNAPRPTAPQPIATQMVLQLNGKDGYVELPPNVFNDLDESTVEAWVKWDRLTGPGWNRVFNYGSGPHDLSIGTMGSDTLWFVIGDAEKGLQHLTAPGVLRLGEWAHVAGVSGKEGMRLYLNAQLVGTNAYSGSFAAMKSGALNRIGKNVNRNDDDL